MPLSLHKQYELFCQGWEDTVTQWASFQGLTAFCFPPRPPETGSGQNRVLPGACVCPLLVAPPPQQDLKAHSVWWERPQPMRASEVRKAHRKSCCKSGPSEVIPSIPFMSRKTVTERNSDSKFSPSLLLYRKGCRKPKGTLGTQRQNCKGEVSGKIERSS